MNGDMIGRVIKGRYKLIDERGRGSFATVYVARDRENNRIYAIKVMHIELSNEEELLARFQREAHILLNLNDPHVVRIIDYGNDNNTHYIVMDYIDGQSLKYHMLQEGQMDPLHALNYAHQIAEGLDAAYKQGVVHRDIKPQNILINSSDMVKITDFGLARSRETVTLTQSNVFMGTAYYISPEQAESGRSADTRSDLYSVATVLFEMLTGRPPYEGETAVDIVIKHMNDKVPSACRLRPGLPIEVDYFMQKALAKSPSDRYATPREFIGALEQLQERIQAMPPIERVARPGDVNGKASQAKPAAAAQKEARIIVIASGQSIPLNGDLMVVGRQDPTLGIFPEINLADKTVGRRHAYVRFQQGKYTVEDLNALNKTRLNGVILAPHEERALKDGDVIRFGSVEVRFELR
ncbi:MAG TPA: FHA domain-containing serine/threonine-protein kinase [Ktedonosporobacter sp.]|jgi:serine/threonine-protein kinase|nr:FHA domain-containing serine/threonine-protein kinase [Ktedonosporobacter sp.]